MNAIADALGKAPGPGPSPGVSVTGDTFGKGLAVQFCYPNGPSDNFRSR